MKLIYILCYPLGIIMFFYTILVICCLGIVLIVPFLILDFLIESRNE